MEQNMEQNTEQYEDIFAAIYANDIEAVKTFLPSYVDARGCWGWTPLHYVCYYGRTEIARLLLDNGADIEAKSNDGWTPLFRACWYGRTEIVELLFDRGANIEARDKDGSTPLHKTCHQGHHEISEFLVSRGANPFVIDQWGKSPLDRDKKIITYKDGIEFPHRHILLQLKVGKFYPELEKPEISDGVSSHEMGI